VPWLKPWNLFHLIPEFPHTLPSYDGTDPTPWLTRMRLLGLTWQVTRNICQVECKSSQLCTLSTIIDSLISTVSESLAVISPATFQKTSASLLDPNSRSASGDHSILNHTPGHDGMFRGLWDCSKSHVANGPRSSILILASFRLAFFRRDSRAWDGPTCSFVRQSGHKSCVVLLNLFQGSPLLPPPVSYPIRGKPQALTALGKSGHGRQYGQAACHVFDSLLQ